jgi:hypothetical protein
MLNPEQLHPYQLTAINLQCSTPSSMLWLDVGLGKTSITLTSAAHLIQQGFLSGVFVVAPVRVCRLVWAREAAKWSHTRHLKFSMVLGSKDQRLRALHQDADVYLINYENLRWLMQTLKQYWIDKGKPLPANGIVWDEISKMKNSGTKRVGAVRHMLKHFKWLTGLTATPASNGYKDLHGQYLVVDKGERLGTAKTAFEKAYFMKQGYKLIPHDDMKEAIHAKIGDITLEMSAADYNPLPDMVVNDIEVELPHTARVQYDQLEKDYFTQLDSGEGIEVFNAASLTNKLLQLSNGSVYPVPGLPMYQPVHAAKLEALEDLIEELSGQQLLLSYAYRSDADRILTHFGKVLKDSPPINLTDCKSDKALKHAMTRWETGDCPLMIGHPASMGHGIDGLQGGGYNLCWFGLNWSLDLYEQFNGRLRRQGQGVPVKCHRIIAPDTMDMAQVEALNLKAGDQAALRKAVATYRNSRR